MAGTASQKFSLAGLARATQASLDWKNWGQSSHRLDVDGPPSEEVLDKLIEAEIIPRLMLTTRESGRPDTAADREGIIPCSIDSGEIDAFARRAVTCDSDTLVEEVHRLLAGGVTHEDLLLKLLAPAARRLGKMWDDDSCDFADVTIGLMKLHRVLERVNAEGPSGMGAGGNSPRVLLAPAPGEQHVFGIVMVGEFFSRSGWRVRCENAPAGDDLVDTVADDHFDVVGISASADANLRQLKLTIKKLRSASKNPDLVVMVGGQVFNEDVGLARRIGADATAADGVRAVVTAERMVHRLARAGRALQA